jgi:hypothetical protein
MNIRQINNLLSHLPEFSKVPLRGDVYAFMNSWALSCYIAEALHRISYRIDQDEPLGVIPGSTIINIKDRYMIIDVEGKPLLFSANCDTKKTGPSSASIMVSHSWRDVLPFLPDGVLGKWLHPEIESALKKAVISEAQNRKICREAQMKDIIKELNDAERQELIEQLQRPIE